MQKEKQIIRIGQVLVWVTALIWGIAGIGYFFQSGHFTQAPAWVFTLLSAVMLAYSAVLVFLGIILPRRQRLFYYVAVLLLFLSATATIFDDFGLVDLAVLLLILVPFIYLLVYRRVFTQSGV